MRKDNIENELNILLEKIKKWEQRSLLQLQTVKFLENEANKSKQKLMNENSTFEEKVEASKELESLGKKLELEIKMVENDMLKVDKLNNIFEFLRNEYERI